MFENSSDPLDYPEHPIVLLAGPPGLGKTTLAKLIAHISGYSLTEVNSSDDRSANTMARILSDATGTHTAFGSRKPRCLILDEIDGATGGDEKSAIAELLKFLKKGRSIQRPIICIANDFFAKSLRPLRQSTHVKIFRLGMPRQETMVSRLQYICRLEGIKADFTSLCSLCDRSDFDIRCCLNILQFVQSSKNGQLLDISSLPIGTKDMATEMFDVLKAIFHKPIYSVTKSEKKTSHFDQVWKAVDSNSDYDSVLAAVHENYPSSGYLDPTLERTADIADWFALSDIITTSSYRGMNSHIESLYAPMVSTVVSLHCSSRHSKRHVFPKSMHQHRQAKYRNEQILSNFYSNSVHCYSLGFRGDGLVLDVLPLLISILNPAAKFRPRVQGAALVTEEVQTVFSSIIETMLSLGLSYRKGSISSDSNEKLADEATSSVIKLSLYPEIDTLLQFEGLPQHNFLTEEIKQMISREIHMESIKRTTIPAVGEIPRNESTVVPESSQDLTVEKVTQTDSNLDLSKKRKTVCLNDALVLNGRKKRLPRRKHDIRYKFLEGFTNAVRRPVDISTFL